MYNYQAKMVRVVDGDTVDLRVDLGFHLFLEGRFRLMGIDTPERGQKKYGEAKELLEDLLTGSDLVITSYSSQEKYGRFLCDIEVILPAPMKRISVQSVMLASGLGKAYDGGKKE